MQQGADGLYDTENPINKLLLTELQAGFRQKKGEVKKTQPKKVAQPKKDSKKDPDNVLGDEVNLFSFTYEEIDYRTKLANAEKLERESELKRIQLEKLAGNLLPIDIVESILTINIQNIFNTFSLEMENFASFYITNRELLTTAIENQKHLLERCISKAMEDSELEIRNAINDYQEVRSRGEKK